MKLNLRITFFLFFSAPKRRGLFLYFSPSSHCFFFLLSTSYTRDIYNGIAAVVVVVVVVAIIRIIQKKEVVGKSS